jgi:hypothetical protein
MSYRLNHCGHPRCEEVLADEGLQFLHRATVIVSSAGSEHEVADMQDSQPTGHQLKWISRAMSGSTP